MTDVARHAKVSLKTVSRYVNGERNIDPIIAQRIAEAVVSLHFRRNMAAASIRPGQRSQLVGLIIDDVANPFYATLTRSIERALRVEGMLLLAASSEQDSDHFGRLVEQFLERRIDGLIVVPPSLPGPRWTELAKEIPALVVLDRFDPAIDADAIVADDEQGGRTATTLLLAGGSRRIAFVGEALLVPTVNNRYRGYLSALSDAGVVPSEALVIDGVHTASDAGAAIAALLRDGVQFDAVFTSNNRASIGVLAAFRELSISRPMVGFDDFEAACLVEPAVTVVAHSVTEMGKLAAQVLLARINGDSKPHRTVVLPTITILRDSHLPRPSPAEVNPEKRKVAP